MTVAIYPKHFNIVQDEAVLEGYGQDSLYSARPPALVRPETTEDVAALLAYCNQFEIPVTPCGNQTSMTGASVTDRGILLSTENLPESFRIYQDPAEPGNWLVDAGPAVILSDLQDHLAEKGFFYPPDPTSRREVRLGATVATNASGEDTYKYGATRAWVKGLTFVRADGEIVRVERPSGERGDGRKNTCGYPMRGHLVDALIGSEGTLGVITQITLRVLPYVPSYFAILFFLPDESSALDEVCRLHLDADFDLRCLEYLDRDAVAIMAEKGAGLTVPENAGAALYIKQEYTDDEDTKMGQWLDHLESLYKQLQCPDFLEVVQFAGDEHSQQLMRDWRHAVPATINERAQRFRAAGGGKVGTDWYVPVEKLKAMFQMARADQGDMTWIVFGHIGNGHPHFNFLAKNAAEYRYARDLLEKHCRLAVSMGGGVSGEHGLGKLKTHLLRYQYPTKDIEAMLALKKQLDPKGILAPGNIFPVEESGGQKG